MEKYDIARNIQGKLIDRFDVIVVGRYSKDSVLILIKDKVTE